MKLLNLVPSALIALAACGGTALAPLPPPPAPAPAPPAPAPKVDTEAFRERAPVAEAEIPFVPPKIEEARLKNGARLLLVERHELPIVALEIVIDRGADQAPPGVGGFMGAMLLQGTKTRSALALSDELDGLGANYWAWVDFDSITVRAQCLSSKLGALLPILADVVKNPAFAPAEIERERAKRLTTIAQQKDAPTVLMSNAVAKTLYPASHSYAFPLIGDAAAVKKLQRAELVQLHAALVKGGALTVSMAGDIAKEQAVAELERVFGDSKSTASSARGVPIAPRPSAAEAARAVIIDRPGAAQSNVSVALVGVPRSTPDYDTLTVMNTLFGGKFSSRLNLNLREKHAYTYGAGSGFSMRRGPGPFTAGGAIVSKATEPAIKEIMNELDRLRSEPVSERELADAQAYLIRQLPARFETALDTATSLSQLAVYGLPLDEYATRPARFAKVTREAIQAAAQKYLVKEQLRLVVVGDASTIKDGLAQLGFGEPQVQKP